MPQRRIATFGPGLAAIACLTVAFIGSAGGSARAQAPAGELLPDLTPGRAGEVSLQTPRHGARRLRLTSAMVNRGPGPMEIYPTRGHDCNGNGNPRDDRVAKQRVYLDGNADGRFDRLDDEVSTTAPVGCMIFHPAHDHWHFQDFAAYELVDEPTGRVLAASSKVGFCIEDLEAIRARLPGKPAIEFYGSCDPDHPQGLSIGWMDVYSAELPGQFIALRGIRDGRYCLQIRADNANRLRESNEANNTSRVPIRLSGRTVRRLRGNCLTPA